MATPGRYTIDRKIADGGMAEIYLGTQHGAAGFERPIIIKRIRSELSADSSFRSMLIDEAHIAMGLNHSNIAQVLDLGTSDGQWFQVLELVDGWDVDTLLRRSLACGLPMPPALALHITAQVCRALGYAHSRSMGGKPLNIVHRDVSPENILVSEQGEVKLADFGIATFVNKRDRTSAGVVKGKLGYMSPEQANAKPLDGRSDVYAMGCSLYVMVTGARPFNGKTELEVLLRQQQGAFDPIDRVAPGLPLPLKAILLKALQVRPEDRYAAAEEMLAEVERVQRMVFQPAGQTELKQWLAELSARDGSQPTTRRPPPMRPPDAPDDELRNGTALVLQEVSSEWASNGVGRSSDRLKTVASKPHRTGGSHTVAYVGAALVSGFVLVGGGVLLTREPEPPPPVEKPAPPVEKPAPVAVEPAPAPPAPVQEEKPASAPVPDEKPAPSKPAGGKEKPGVQVRFVSEPPGASVIVNSKDFGKTPTSIRFAPGLVNDVVFKLAGYEDVPRRVYVSESPWQTVKVALKKKR